MKVRKNDLVVVIAGNYRGKRGRVLKVFPKKDRIIVEGVNFIKKHTKPSPKNPQGGIIQMEAPIHVSNVMVVCSKCNSPTRVGRKILEDGSKLRVCKKCGEMLVAA